MKKYLESIWKDPAAARKFIVALIGALIVIASQGLLGPEAAHWVALVVPVLTALGVYHVRNDAPKNNG